MNFKLHRISGCKKNMTHIITISNMHVERANISCSHLAWASSLWRPSEAKLCLSRPFLTHLHLYAHRHTRIWFISKLRFLLEINYVFCCTLDFHQYILENFPRPTCLLFRWSDIPHRGHTAYLSRNAFCLLAIFNGHAYTQTIRCNKQPCVHNM